MKKGYFISGFGVTPNSGKFAALSNAMAPYGCELEISDFTNLYSQRMRYADFVQKVVEDLERIRPDFAVSFSFGFPLYQNAVAQNRELEAKKFAAIVPLGNYAASENGRRILQQGIHPADIYKPINELKIAHNIDHTFFKDMADDDRRNRHCVFSHNTMMVSGIYDCDVDPEQFNRMKTQGVPRRFSLADDHRMTNSMPYVCDIVRGFVLNS